MIERDPNQDPDYRRPPSPFEGVIVYQPSEGGLRRLRDSEGREFDLVPRESGETAPFDCEGYLKEAKTVIEAFDYGASRSAREMVLASRLLGAAKRAVEQDRGQRTNEAMRCTFEGHTETHCVGCCIEQQNAEYAARTDNPRNEERKELTFIVSYLAHNDQDANHAWMVRRIRAVLAGKDPCQVEPWSEHDGVREPRPTDTSGWLYKLTHTSVGVTAVQHNAVFALLNALRDPAWKGPRPQCSETALPEAPPPSGSICFVGRVGDRVPLELRADGKILRDGREVADDADLVDGLRAWLARTKNAPTRDALVEKALAYLEKNCPDEGEVRIAWVSHDDAVQNLADLLGTILLTFSPIETKKPPPYPSIPKSRYVVRDPYGEDRFYATYDEAARNLREHKGEWIETLPDTPPAPEKPSEAFLSGYNAGKHASDSKTPYDVTRAWQTYLHYGGSPDPIAETVDAAIAKVRKPKNEAVLSDFTPRVETWDVRVIEAGSYVRTVFAVKNQYFTIFEGERDDPEAKHSAEWFEKVFRGALEVRDAFVRTENVEAVEKALAQAKLVCLLARNLDFADANLPSKAIRDLREALGPLE